MVPSDVTTGPPEEKPNGSAEVAASDSVGFPEALVP